MKTQKILLGGIAGGVAYFFLGWLVYGILLMDYSTANYNQCAMKPMEDMVWWSLILSNLGFGFLLSTVISWSNSSGIMSGLRVGGILGFLLSVSLDFNFYAMTDMFSNLTTVFVDILVVTLMTAVVGMVVGWVMSMGKK